jgi:hypothetical protein
MPADVSFVGYEISPQAFELCRDRSADRLNFYLKDLFEDASAYYDTVLAIDIIEHIDGCIDFLSRLRKKGLYKIFHIPLNLSVQTVLRSTPIIRGRRNFGHIQYFTKETAIASLVDAGYEIVDHFYTEGSTDMRPKSFKSLLAWLPRKIMFGLNKDIAVRLLGGYSLIVLAK